MLSRGSAAAPRISVLMPFRNAAQTIAETLESIRRQSFGAYELIAVDDGSCDASARIVARCAAKDPRIRLYPSPEQGLVAALNMGLQLARSKLIARMDADDRMHPQRLELQFRYLERHPEIGLVSCQARAFPESVLQQGYREYIRWQNLCLSPEQIAANLFVESPLPHPSVLFRRELVLQLGGYRQGPFPEDYDLWLRLHEQGERMAKLPRVLLDWRESPYRTSRQDPRYAREAFDRLRAEYLARCPLLRERRRELVIWGAGRKTRKRCAHLLARGYEPQAWVDIDPKKIGNRLRGVPVVAPGWLCRRPKPMVLCYVSNHGARELIARDLHAMGYRRSRDYLMVG
jgi:glycosyltransferase involved in cell wall biosynthesis